MAKQDYIAKNKEWLAEKAKDPEVIEIGGGVLRRVMKSGDKGGKSPDRSNVVTVHYTGRTINGKKFDSSRGGVAPAFRLRDLIEGWIIALQQMKPGDVWEIYVPADKGYGRRSEPGIPGGSTLIFEIELIGVA